MKVELSPAEIRTVLAQFEPDDKCNVDERLVKAKLEAIARPAAQKKRGIPKEENADLLQAMANDILVDLASALKQFGEYSFDDKGPDEVMDLDKWASKLRNLQADQAGRVMKLVGEGRKDGRGERLRDQFAIHLQDQPDQWFEVMLETSGAEY